MTSGKLRSRLLFLHRALALVLAPFLLVLVLSGSVLAFAPLVGDDDGPRAAVDGGKVLAALAAVDPEGTAGLLLMDPGGASFELRSRGQGVRGHFDLASGQKLPPAEEGFDVFETAERLHKGLLLGLNPLMEAMAFVLLALLLIGPFVIGRLGLATWMQRHGTFGLLLWPLLALPPVTGVMMVLHLGEPARPAEAPPEARLTLARGLELATPALDLSRLTAARRWPSGEVLVYLATAEGEEIFKVAAEGPPQPFTPARNWPHELHEGRWFQGASLINLASALGLLTLMITGLRSWWRNRRKSLGSA